MNFRCLIASSLLKYFICDRCTVCKCGCRFVCFLCVCLFVFLGWLFFVSCFTCHMTKGILYNSVTRDIILVPKRSELPSVYACCLHRHLPYMAQLNWNLTSFCFGTIFIGSNSENLRQLFVLMLWYTQNTNFIMLLIFIYLPLLITMHLAKTRHKKQAVKIIF